MPAETFQASRWTKGNLFFPTYIIVDEQAVNQLYRQQCVNLTGVISAFLKVTANDCLNGAAIPVRSGKRPFVKQHLAYIL